jgi:protein TonB
MYSAIAGVILFSKIGEKELLKFITQNALYPKIDKENNNQGTVFVTFVIDENGEVTSVESIRGPSKAMRVEAERVINLMPQWQAGKNNGRAVKVRFSLPVVFKLK